MHPSKYSASSVKSSVNEHNVPIKHIVTHSGGLCGRWFESSAAAVSTNCDLFYGSRSDEKGCLPKGNEQTAVFANFWL